MARVLIVDDDELLLLLGAFMESKGIDHELALNVAQARKLLEKRRFDVVISDFNMPDESGFDLYRHIASHYPEMRFILMTGCGGRSHELEARGIGINAYIEKPFHLTELLQVMESP